MHGGCEAGGDRTGSSHSSKGATTMNGEPNAHDFTASFAESLHTHMVAISYEMQAFANLSRAERRRLSPYASVSGVPVVEDAGCYAVDGDERGIK